MALYANLHPYPVRVQLSANIYDFNPGDWRPQEADLVTNDALTGRPVAVQSGLTEVADIYAATHSEASREPISV